ncbi:MAG: hypothetical protein M1825_005688 [Sarcosagium campestre]|nr:MAG: hypothetical protein M1825_005688 [Sarcosagium campestre]
MANVTDLRREPLQPICQNCTTSTTPLWRRDEIGSVLCNACGLFLKLHGRPRPISLKTDVIKSRNRVKSSGQAPKKKSLFDGNGLPASQSEAGTPPPGTLGHRRASGKTSSGTSNGSTSPLSRTGTPGVAQASHHGPHALFDGASLSDHAFRPSPVLPSLQFKQSPPAPSAPGDRHQERQQSYEALLASNTALKTRVSELEVINGLYRGRVTELENEANARRTEQARSESEERLREALSQVERRESALKRRLEAMELEVSELREEAPRAKKMRVSELVDDTPGSSSSPARF